MNRDAGSDSWLAWKLKMSTFASSYPDPSDTQQYIIKISCLIYIVPHLSGCLDSQRKQTYNQKLVSSGLFLQLGCFESLSHILTVSAWPPMQGLTQ